MSEAKTQSTSVTAGMNTILNPYKGILTSDEKTSKDDYFDAKDIRTISTEGSKKISLEDLAELVVTVMPDFEPITKRDLILIKEQNTEIGAISAYLDSTNKLLEKIEKNLDDGFKKFDLIKDKF